MHYQTLSIDLALIVYFRQWSLPSGKVAVAIISVLNKMYILRVGIQHLLLFTIGMADWLFGKLIDTDVQHMMEHCTYVKRPVQEQFKEQTVYQVH